MAKFNFMFIRPNGTRVSMHDAINQILFGIDIGDDCDCLFNQTFDVINDWLIPKMNAGENFQDIRYGIIDNMTNAYYAMKNALDGSAEQDSLTNDWCEWRFKYQTMNLLEMWGFRVRLADVEEDLPPITE